MRLVKSARPSSYKPRDYKLREVVAEFGTGCVNTLRTGAGRVPDTARRPPLPKGETRREKIADARAYIAKGT